MARFYLTLALVATCCLFTALSDSFAQPPDAVYPDKQTNGGVKAGGGFTGDFSVSNPDNARNTVTNTKPNNNYALLTATSTLGTSTAWIQLEFPAEVPSSAGAPVTVYVRTDDNTAALLGGLRLLLRLINCQQAESHNNLVIYAPLPFHMDAFCVWLGLRAKPDQRSIHMQGSIPAAYSRVRWCSKLRMVPTNPSQAPHPVNWWWTRKAPTRPLESIPMDAPRRSRFISSLKTIGQWQWTTL